MFLMKSIFVLITLVIKEFNGFFELDFIVFYMVSFMILLCLFFTCLVYVSIKKQNTNHSANIMLLKIQLEKFYYKNQKHHFYKEDFREKDLEFTEKIERLKNHILGVNLLLNSKLSK